MGRQIVAAAIVLLLAPGSAGAQTSSELDRCLTQRGIPRVARVLDPDNRAVYARVVDVADGMPVAFVTIAPHDVPLAQVFERAAQAAGPTWKIPAVGRICSPVRMAQAEIDAERGVIVAAGLNYAAHAEEAGGGSVFLFPKPVAPTPPYGAVTPPAGVTLLDYEVELGFVLLEDVDLRDLPSPEALLARSAFLVTNDVSDREPIIAHAEFGGPGTGFIEAKGQPSFLPAGPWMVRGTELFAALAECGATGLGIRLGVDAGDGFITRQDSSTALMILDPHALLEAIREDIERTGLRTPMPVRRADQTRYYPLAVDADAPRLPAGSLVLTGTPDGVTLHAPSPLGVTLRGLLRLRSPFEQFRLEEIERARTQISGGYLRAGQRMRASIDGLGAQIVRIGAANGAQPADPCGGR